MPSHVEHMRFSTENLLKKHSEFFKLRRGRLINILHEMHYWFDYFMWKKSEKGEYDYTDVRDLAKHREQRHHYQGIHECVKIFSDKYWREFVEDGFGEEFEKVIWEEANFHIRKDYERFCQAPFSKEIYDEIGFWRRLGVW
jgi:hypothetical protein